MGDLSAREDGERTRADRKRVYKRVLRTVDGQTSPAQPPICTRHVLRTVLCGHANVPGEHVASAVRAAVENADLLALTDPRRGCRAYALTDIGTLRRVNRWLAAQPGDTQREHARVNRAIAEADDAE